METSAKQYQTGKKMTIDLMSNEFYNAYADSFDKIPFEDIPKVT